MLHIGNIEFIKKENQDSWSIKKDVESSSSSRGLKIGCKLLGVEEDKLEEALTVRKISVAVAKKVISIFYLI